VPIKAHLANHLRREEQEVFLPAHPQITKADILITTNLPGNIVAYLSLLKYSYTFASELTLDDMVTFVVKVNCTENVAAQRQLTLDLTCVRLNINDERWVSKTGRYSARR
jgi:hypothetical protein